MSTIPLPVWRRISPDMFLLPLAFAAFIDGALSAFLAATARAEQVRAATGQAPAVIRDADALAQAAQTWMAARAASSHDAVGRTLDGLSAEARALEARLLAATQAILERAAGRAAGSPPWPDRPPAATQPPFESRMPSSS